MGNKPIEDRDVARHRQNLARKAKWKQMISQVLEGLEEKKRSNNERRLSFDNTEKFQTFHKTPQHLRLEEHIELDHLYQLMETFDNHRPPTVAVEGESKYAPTRYERREPGSLNPQEFKETISGVLETRQYDEQLDKLFTKLDTSADGYVDWNEFITYMMLHYRENDYVRTKKSLPFQQEPVIRHIIPNKQETTVRVFLVDSPTRFTSINRDGIICIWSQFFRLEKSIPMDHEEEETNNNPKHKVRMWVTDAHFMPNCHKIVVSSTRRDLRFFDIASNNIKEDYCLYGLRDVVCCMDYHYNKQDPNNDSMLLWGSESGDINIFTFHKPVTQLFEKQFTNNQSRTKIYMQDMQRHEKCVHHRVVAGVHTEMIRQICYEPSNGLVLSCSGSSRTSLVIVDIKGYKKAYVFKLHKGISCFAFSKQLEALATGTTDYMVRLWNPYVPAKPTALLEGHYSGIIDVAIYEPLAQVLSYSRDAILKVWDLKDHTCLQTIILKFPTSMNGHVPEHGPFPFMLHHGSGHNSCLIIACNDYMAELRFGIHAKQKDNMPITHTAPLCTAVYNPFFEEVVTAADDSSIIVWDLDSGTKNLVFENAHGEEEITCIAFDGNWRRLITGARDGTLKIWNFQNGHNLNRLNPSDPSEVTGIVALKDKKYILSVSWGRKLIKYDDDEPESLYVDFDDNWKGGHLHKEDILAMAYGSPHLIATGSFDGEIIVWTLETEMVIVKLNSPRQSQRVSSQQSSFRTSGQRPNSRHRSTHKPSEREPAPIDKLLFLQARINARTPESAILVSSEGGLLKWWSVFGTQSLLGSFRATDFPDESVLGMCTSEDNSVFVTCDTLGYIYVWNITCYCTKPQQTVVTSRPPMSRMWHAHDSAVVSVDLAEHKTGVYVISASSDRTARLWTVEGKFIGTFGQTTEWNLQYERTWAHPYTPWSSEYISSQVLQASTQPKDADSNESSNNNSGDQGKRAGRERVKTPSLAAIAAEVKATLDPRSSMNMKSLTTMEGRPDTDDDGLVNLGRAKTFHAFGNQAFAKPSIIGSKAEGELTKITLHRQARRSQFGRVRKEETSGFGTACCPFQVLLTPTINDNLLSSNLPVSTRMMSRGYTSEAIDVRKLQTMDFKALDMGDDEFRRKAKHLSKGIQRAGEAFQLPDIAANNKVVSMDSLSNIMEPLS